MRIRTSRREFLKSSTIASASLLAATNFSSLLDAAEPQRASGWESFRNGLANQGIAKSEFPQEPTLLWEVVSKDGVPSTPLIGDGKTYVGTLSGDLLCLDLQSGKEIWKYKSVEEVDPNSFPPGFRSPIAMDASGVYGGDDLGTFHAVDRSTGKKRWTLETDGEIVGGPQILGDRVLFGSHDGYLYCCHSKTGKQIWKSETHGPVNATPCISGNFTFTTGCDQPILRVFNVQDGSETAEVPIESLLIASPAEREGILYFGTDSGSVYALDWQKKETVWTFSVPNREQQIQSSPAVTEDLVIIGSRDKYCYAIDRKSGELKWAFPTRARIDSSPVVVGDRVFFGCSDKNLYCVNLRDGKEVWKHFARQSIIGSPAIAEGKLVIGTDPTNGKILCFG